MSKVMRPLLLLLFILLIGIAIVILSQEGGPLNPSNFGNGGNSSPSDSTDPYKQLNVSP